MYSPPSCTPQGHAEPCCIYTEITYLFIKIPEGYEVIASALVERAVQRVLSQLYVGMNLPSGPIMDLIPFGEERNEEIYRRYLAGERAVDLAKDNGISLRRIYVLIRIMKQHR
jgi:hypothetical protein